MVSRSVFMLKIALTLSWSIPIYWHLKSTNNDRNILHTWLDKDYRSPDMSSVHFKYYVQMASLEIFLGSGQTISKSSQDLICMHMFDIDNVNISTPKLRNFHRLQWWLYFWPSIQWYRIIIPTSHSIILIAIVLYKFGIWRRTSLGNTPLKNSFSTSGSENVLFWNPVTWPLKTDTVGLKKCLSYRNVCLFVLLTTYASLILAVILQHSCGDFHTIFHGVMQFIFMLLSSRRKIILMKFELCFWSKTYHSTANLGWRMIKHISEMILYIILSTLGQNWWSSQTVLIRKY